MLAELLAGCGHRRHARPAARAPLRADWVESVTLRAPSARRAPPTVAAMLAVARTFSLLGVEAREVRVEADVRAGLPSFALVGLPDAAVRESRERVRAALVNSGFEYPQKRITANLAPGRPAQGRAGLRPRDCRRRPRRDRAASRARARRSSRFGGELALDGSIRPVPGTMAMAEAASRAGIRIAVAAASGPEAALASGGGVVPVERLEQLRALGGDDEPQRTRCR